VMTRWPSTTIGALVPELRFVQTMAPSATFMQNDVPSKQVT